MKKEKYHIEVPNGAGGKVALILTILEETDEIIQFELKGRNRAIKLQCDLPAMLKKGETHWRLNWKITEGTLNEDFFLNVCHRLTQLLKLRMGVIPQHPEF